MGSALCVSVVQYIGETLRVVLKKSLNPNIEIRNKFE